MARPLNTKSSEQCQEQDNLQAEFLMQEVLNGVLQQLERIERVVEHTHRKYPMNRSKVGDRNHTNPDTNFQALKTKLMAFSKLQNISEGRFVESSENCVRKWISRRSVNAQYSEEFRQALEDTLEACKGNYSPSVQPVEMSEEMLQDCSQRLAEAAHQWHKKEARFQENPEAAVNKPQMYKISASKKPVSDARREKVNTASKSTKSPTQAHASEHSSDKPSFDEATGTVTQISQEEERKDKGGEERKSEDSAGTTKTAKSTKKKGK